MRDNELFILVRQWLATAAPLRGIVGAEYILSFQPTQQGRPSQRAVRMFVVANKRYGYRKTVTVNGDGTGLMPRTETQAMETTLQFAVTQPLDLDDAALTHGDVLKTIAACLQSDDAVQFFIANGASVLRVGDVRGGYVINDRGQHEENPSFDIVIKHNDVFIDGVPQVHTFEFEILSVPNLV